MRRARFGPARTVVVFYAITVSIGTLLLALPFTTVHEGRATFSTALFTAASATCITGMSPVDVATYWNPFGHVVILLLVQAGGLGIVTLSARLLQLMHGRMGIEGTLAAQADAHTDTPAHARSMIRIIVRFYLALSHSSGSSLFTGFFLSTCTYAHIFPTTKTNKNPHTHLASLIPISLSLSLVPATTELPGGLSHVGRTHSWATQSLVCPVPGGSVPTISGSP